VDPRLGFFLDANQYSHPPIEAQLTDFNVRALEFDVYDDRPGGKFAWRTVRAVLGLDELLDDSPEMINQGELRAMFSMFSWCPSNGPCPSCFGRQ
jgi:hypothetical protein